MGLVENIVPRWLVKVHSPPGNSVLNMDEVINIWLEASPTTMFWKNYLLLLPVS
jgi:hypothetical protein